MRHFTLAFALCLFGATLISCGGGGGGGGNTTTVDVSPNTVQLQAGGQQQFTANVHHAHGDKSVTWSLSGTGCSGAACGTLDSSTANPVTYTAPATPPSSNLTVTLTATSADGISASASITVLALAVSVSPGSASVPVNTTQQFTANVVSDPSNGGVTWALTQNGVACAPACGTISANSSLSGAPINYTAPTTAPASASVTLTATSVADTTKSFIATITITSAAAACGSGSESLLTGQYAFLVQGFDASGPVAIAGSFIADGTGKITSGGEDINRTSGPQTNLTISSSGSSASAYSVGSDHRGCLTLVSSAGTTTVFRFAVGGISGMPTVASKGRIIEFDDSSGSGTRGSGIIGKQDVASFAASLSGVYAFGLSGSGSVGRFAIAGTVAAGGGNFTNGNADSDSPGGAVATNVVCAACGTYSTSLDPNGRGTSTSTFPPPLVTVHFAFYQLSADEAIFLSTDAVASVPIQSGEALREAVPGSYTNASLNATSVLHLEGFGGAGTSLPSVTVGIVTIPSSGNFSATIDQDFGGTSTNNTVVSGTYSVASNGRAVLTATSGGGHHVPVLYLIGANNAFLVGTGGSAEVGVLEPQQGSNFSNSSLNGNYFFGTQDPTGNAVTMQTGAATLNGNGNISGTADSSGTGGLTHGQTISGSYSVTSNGAGTIGANGVLIVISSAKFIYIDESTGGNPSITVAEQ